MRILAKMVPETLLIAQDGGTAFYWAKVDCPHVSMVTEMMSTEVVVMNTTSFTGPLARREPTEAGQPDSQPIILNGCQVQLHSTR